MDIVKKAINQQKRQALIDAAARVIDSGWYVLGQEVKAFEEEFCLQYTRHIL
jgi:dTDP-4-amino-4,6-dideoxygalactose transaminase